MRAGRHTAVGASARTRSRFRNGPKLHRRLFPARSTTGTGLALAKRATTNRGSGRRGASHRTCAAPPGSRNAGPRRSRAATRSRTTCGVPRSSGRVRGMSTATRTAAWDGATTAAWRAARKRERSPEERSSRLRPRVRPVRPDPLRGVSGLPRGGRPFLAGSVGRGAVGGVSAEQTRARRGAGLSPAGKSVVLASPESGTGSADQHREPPGISMPSAGRVIPTRSRVIRLVLRRNAGLDSEPRECGSPRISGRSPGLRFGRPGKRFRVFLRLALHRRGRNTLTRNGGSTVQWKYSRFRPSRIWFRFRSRVLG